MARGIPRGANAATVRRCHKHLKGKVANPYASCNAVGAGRGGKKGRRRKK